MESNRSAPPRPPFTEGFDPERVYVGGPFAEALARLRFLAEQRRGGLVLAGPGMGKTILLALAARRWRRSGRLVAWLACEAEGIAPLLDGLLRALGDRPAPAAVPQLLGRLRDRLRECRHQEIDPILLIDAAERLDPPADLDRLVRTLESGVHPEHRPTVLLAARPEWLASGGRTAEVLELRISLRPLSVGETAEYLARQLEWAGMAPDRFDDPAVEQLHRRAGGVPRRISHLARLSLVAASARNAGRVSAGIVDGVYRELSPLAVSNGRS